MRRKLLWVALLYFAEGMPFGLVLDNFPVYFRLHGVSLAAIGALSLLRTPWWAKVFWSPLVDQVPDAAAEAALRGRVKQAGIRVSHPYDHGFCVSIYFKGPDGEQLEVTYQTRPLGAEELDAATFRALGISAEERAAMTR